MRALIVRKAFVVFALTLIGATAQSQTNPNPYLYPLPTMATSPGGSAFSLSVEGTGFASGAVVNWNGSPRATTFISSSQLMAAIAAQDIAEPQTAVVTVTNPAPGGRTSNPQLFQVTTPTTNLAFQDSLLGTAEEVVVGDFNHDGKPDLVVMVLVPDTQNYHYVLQILLGNGDGTFQTPVNVLVGPNSVELSGLTVGDFNGDGNLDLVGSFQDFREAPYDTAVLALLGNGDGTFQAPQVSDIDTTGFTLSPMTLVADVNGDGIPDLVRACRKGVCVELGAGDGTFRQQFRYTVNSPTGSGPIPTRSVAVGDFHKNGKLDIAAVFDDDNLYYLAMLPGNGDGTFGPASVIDEGQTPTQVSLMPSVTNSVLAADFDNDGNLDLALGYVSISAGSGALSILRGNGDGSFQAPATLSGLPNNSGPLRLVAGDFNGDGHLDLAMQNVIVLIGNGDGPFSYSVIPISTPSLAAAAADFTADGRLELVGIDASGSLHVLSQTPPQVDFSGSINPSDQSVVPGGAVSYTISISALNGFSGTVQFSANGLPPGATATFAPNVVTGSGNIAVTISSTSATPPGSYPITFTGTSGALTHTGGVTLNVGPPNADFSDFAASVNAAFQSVVPGSTAIFQISVAPINGFADDVNLSLTGLPPGVTATFGSPTVTHGLGQSVLFISTSAATPTATYPLILTASGGGRTHSSGISVNVGPESTDFTDFTGSVTPTSQTVQVGGSASFSVTIQPLNGTGCVSLQGFGVPAATIGQFDRTSPICGSSGSSVFTIVTSTQTPAGTYTVTFEGKSSGGHVHDRSVTLTVVQSP